MWFQLINHPTETIAFCQYLFQDKGPQSGEEPENSIYVLDC